MKYFLAILSGTLLGLPFYKAELFFLAWIGLVPFLFSLAEENKKESFFLGWLMGLTFFGIGGKWIIYPLLDFSGLPIVVVLLVFVLALFILATFLGLFAIILKLLEARFNLHYLLLVPVSWTAIEYLRTIFSFSYLFGFLGYSQSLLPELIQLAEYGGVYLVTFIIVIVNTLLFLAIKEKKAHYILISLLIVGLVFYQGSSKLAQPVAEKGELAVGIIQPNIPQQIKMDPAYQDLIAERLLELSNHEIEENSPDLLIWPETAILRTYNEEQKIPFDFIEETPLFFGGFIRSSEGNLNSSFLADADGNIMTSYSKMNLVPFGEYTPFAEVIPDSMLGNLNNLVPGIEKEKFVFNDFSWVSPICSEILNSSLVRSLDPGSDLLITIANEAWFGKSNLPFQMIQATIFRAVEHNFPIIKVGNTGISAVVSNQGEILTKTETFKRDSKTFDLTIPTRKTTLYHKYGDLFGLISLVVTLILVGVICFERFNAHYITKEK
ncbi:apolipoprotein N-acyltransferase [Natroniella sulfidigena]|uniref:apolipoprotein N-acyltransferase n=1 Tax=Natroniella sulfidigena TaxID=723921 RepID=UPI002009DBF0|nr:apolipoprotein N-acyltransferase [Natroniella sulfidigena]MCK8817271.1 apolipoprotein N-acyltransferase [Natroniella sulfidigena]